MLHIKYKRNNQSKFTSLDKRCLPSITKLPSFGVDTTVTLEIVVGEFFDEVLDLFTVELVEDFDNFD
jgi:hypothetical protein